MANYVSNTLTRTALLTSAMFLAAAVIADEKESGTPDDISWSTIDCGGGVSTDGTLELAGTIGQHDASITMTVGTFELTGGFWGGSPVPVPICEADVTGDDVVNANDLLEVINNWGPCVGCAADVNNDDVVNADDLLIVINNWGPC